MDASDTAEEVQKIAGPRNVLSSRITAVTDVHNETDTTNGEASYSAGKSFTSDILNFNTPDGKTSVSVTIPSLTTTTSPLEITKVYEFEEVLSQVGSLSGDVAKTISYCHKLKNENAHLKESLDALKHGHLRYRDKCIELRSLLFEERSLRKKIEDNHDSLVNKWRKELEAKAKEFANFEQLKHSMDLQLRSDLQDLQTRLDDEHHVNVESMASQLVKVQRRCNDLEQLNECLQAEKELSLKLNTTSLKSLEAENSSLRMKLSEQTIMRSFNEFLKCSVDTLSDKSSNDLLQLKAKNIKLVSENDRLRNELQKLHQRSEDCFFTRLEKSLQDRLNASIHAVDSGRDSTFLVQAKVAELQHALYDISSLTKTIQQQKSTIFKISEDMLSSQTLDQISIDKLRVEVDTLKLSNEGLRTQLEIVGQERTSENLASGEKLLIVEQSLRNEKHSHTHTRDELQQQIDSLNKQMMQLQHSHELDKASNFQSASELQEQLTRTQAELRENLHNFTIDRKDFLKTCENLEHEKAVFHDEISHLKQKLKYILACKRKLQQLVHDYELSNKAISSELTSLQEQNMKLTEQVNDQSNNLKFLQLSQSEMDACTKDRELLTNQKESIRRRFHAFKHNNQTLIAALKALKDRFAVEKRALLKQIELLQEEKVQSDNLLQPPNAESRHPMTDK